MPINFDALPSDAPNNLPEDGQYRAKIEKAEMKVSPTSGNTYLNLALALSKDGKGYGKIFDIITESDNDIQRYKLRRLIEALNIPMHGSFELRDLTKIIVGKSMLVDVIQEHKEGKRDKAVVDVFKGLIYYPIEEAANASYTESTASAPVPEDDDLPFSTSDDENDGASESTEY
jgi:hypothetical protein